jgi:hypothetical protein
MPPSDPRHRGERPEDRPDRVEAGSRRRGRFIVSGVVLAGFAIVLGVLLLVPRCGSAVQGAGALQGDGSAAGRPQAVEQALPG